MCLRSIQDLGLPESSVLASFKLRRSLNCAPSFNSRSGDRRQSVGAAVRCRQKRRLLLQDLSCPGLFATVPTPIALDILTGELRLFAKFDVLRFFGFAERHGITMKWGTRNESEQAIRKKLSVPIPCSGGAAVVALQRAGSIRFFIPFYRGQQMVLFFKLNSVDTQRCIAQMTYIRPSRRDWPLPRKLPCYSRPTGGSCHWASPNDRLV